MHLFTFFVSYIHLRGEDGGDTVSESENKNEINENNNLANTDFMREKIKARPISRKKLLRRTIITVSLAVVFGGVACITFLLLQPVINNTLYPENQPEPVTFPEETESDEMTPEDMYVDEEEIAADAAAQAAEAASTMQETNKEQLQSLIESYKFTAEDYNEMNTALKEVAKNASKSVVTVTAVTSDYNWFNDTYESSGDDTGVIVADNGPGFALSKEELGNPFITAKPAGIGMGIGLHLTKEIMNSLNGKLLFPEPDDFDIPEEFKKGAIVALAFKKEK